MLVVERLMSLAGAPSELSIGRALDGACMIAWLGICSSVVLHRVVMLGSCNAWMPAGGPQPATDGVS
jgi:hypothetical protein